MKMKKRVSCLLIALSISTIMPQCVNAEWKNFGQSKYYYDDNGHMVTNQWFYERSSGKCFYFQSDGSMATGLKQINGGYYYFGTDGGRVVGNVNIDGKLYQTDNTGKILDISNEEAKEISLSNIKTKYDLDKYLEENYSTLKTPIGTLKFTYYINENEHNISSYDYWIETKYGDISDSPYSLAYFSPTLMESSIKISDADKEETKELLKDFQREIAEVCIQVFPSKKIKGEYYDSWYRYPNLKVDLITCKYCSWSNYNSIDEDEYPDYENTEVTSFHWDDDYDD